MKRSTFLGTLLKWTACAALALSFSAQIQAADVAGTWSWTRPGRNGGPDVKTTLKLKVDGDKVTGTVTAPGRQGNPGREVEITDGKVKGDDVSFSVVREAQGNKFTTKYSGKVSGDSIKGKTEVERNGQSNTRDWEAKREK